MSAAASAKSAQDLGPAANEAVTFVKQLDEAVDVTPVDFDSTINDGHFTPNNHRGSSRATAADSRS